MTAHRPDEPLAAERRNHLRLVSAARRPDTLPSGDPVQANHDAWRQLPTAAQTYIAVVTGLGTAAFILSLSQITEQQAPLCAAFILLSAVASIIKVELPVPRSVSTLTVGYIVDYLALILMGTHPAAVAAAAGAWSQCTFRSRFQNPSHQTLFSVACLTLTVHAAGAVYTWFGVDRTGSATLIQIEALVATATVFFVTNTGLIAGAIALSTGQSALFVWADNFLSTWPGFLLGAGVAAAGAEGLDRSGLWLLPIVGAAAALTYVNLRSHAARLVDSSTDALTGVPNVRFLHAHGTYEIGRARRRSDSITICFLDLDGFKAVNDDLGHDAGDKVLKLVAAHLSDMVGSQGICARLGGDEFVVLLPGRRSDEAGTLVRRIRAAVADIELRGLPKNGIGVSIGVSEFPRDGYTLEDLLAAADARMYRDKAERRHSQRRTGLDRRHNPDQSS